MAVTINGSGGLTFNDGSSQNTAALPGMRNRIINGDMRIDQRNAGASVTNINGGIYSVDRWQLLGYQASKFTAQQNAGAVTPPAGFVNYLGCTSSSAYSVPAGEYFTVGQKIEGLNIADLGWGTANAKAVTLSFWVRSSLTGTFGGSLSNNAVNRSYPFSYAISAANTWEQKSVTIAGDTSGTWLTTNGSGILLYFSLGSGSTFSGTAGSWAGSQLTSATGAVSVVGTNGATFYITGVQLEAGSVATPFENRHYGQELALCQRYYTTSVAYFAGPTVAGYGNVYSLMFPVTMRAAASLTSTGGAAVGNMTTVTTSNITANGFVATANNNGTGGGSANNGWTVSAEL